MIYCYTGDGKGKTTAALGLAFRASGYDMKVCIIQFMKGTWHTGELDAVKAVPQIDLIQAGKGFFKILDDQFTEEEHRAAAEEALKLIEEKIQSERYDIVILDEVNTTVDLELLKANAVWELLEKAPKNMHFVLTGRDAPELFIEKADLVSEMKEIKHPYQKGILAQRGLDF